MHEILCIELQSLKLEFILLSEFLENMKVVSVIKQDIISCVNEVAYLNTYFVFWIQPE